MQNLSVKICSDGDSGIWVLRFSVRPFPMAEQTSGGAIMNHLMMCAFGLLKVERVHTSWDGNWKWSYTFAERIEPRKDDCVCACARCNSANLQINRVEKFALMSRIARESAMIVGRKTTSLLIDQHWESSWINGKEMANEHRGQPKAKLMPIKVQPANQFKQKGECVASNFLLRTGKNGNDEVVKSFIRQFSISFWCEAHRPVPSKRTHNTTI